MTNFNPAPIVAINGVTPTALVDFNLTWSDSCNSIYDGNTGQTGTATLYTLADAGMQVLAGDSFAIQHDSLTGGGIQDITGGQITDVSVSYLDGGAVGRIAQWNITWATRRIDKSYNLDAPVTTTASDYLTNYINPAWYAPRWQDMDPTQTWDGVEAWRAWNSWSTTRWTASVYNNYNVYFPAGERNLADDLDLLMTSTRSQQVNNTVYIGVINNTYRPVLGPFSAGLATLDSLQLTQSLTDVRNALTITMTDGGTTYAADSESQSNYGTAAGTMESCLDVVTDAQNIGQLVIKGTAVPVSSLTHIQFELANPNFTDSERQTFWFAERWAHYEFTNVPATFGSASKFITRAATHRISKGSWTVDLDLVDWTTYYGGNTWDQIPLQYTWTSYGVAFPTTKWSDL